MNLFIKICDFGESHHNDFDSKDEYKFNRGKTHPYAPPELVKHLDQGFALDYKNDIYSFGAMLSDTIFEKKIVDFKKSNMNNYVKKLKKNMIKLYTSNPAIKSFGCKHTMKLIKILFYKLCNPDFK